MVQYNCHQCVWTNSLLCSLYWLRAAQTYSEKWNTVLLRPKCSIWSIAGCSSINFHALPVADLLFLPPSFLCAHVITELFCQPEHWTLLLSEASMRPSRLLNLDCPGVTRRTRVVFPAEFVEEEVSQHTVLSHNPFSHIFTPRCAPYNPRE